MKTRHKQVDREDIVARYEKRLKELQSVHDLVRDIPYDVPIIIDVSSYSFACILLSMNHRYLNIRALACNSNSGLACSQISFMSVASWKLIEKKDLPLMINWTVSDEFKGLFKEYN